MEKINHKNYFLVGVITLLGIFLLFFGIRFLQVKVVGEKVTYHAMFPNIGTLNIGDPVKISGVTLGKVIRIELSQGQVKVSFKLKTSVKDKETGVIYPINLPINSKISIQNVGLMGERKIEITLGNSNQHLIPGSTFQIMGHFDSGIPEVMAQAGKVLSQTNQIFKEISQNAQILFKNMHSTINTLDSTVQFMQRLHTPIQTITQNLERITMNLSSISDSLNDPTFLTHIKNFTEQADSIVTHINTSKTIQVDVDLF